MNNTSGLDLPSNELLVTEPSNLTIGDECFIMYRDTNYGMWRFEGCISGKMCFSDKNDARLLIPKINGKMAQANGWLVIPEG